MGGGIKAFEVYGDFSMKNQDKVADQIKKFTADGKGAGLALGAAGVVISGAGKMIEKSMDGARKTGADYASQVVMIQRTTGMAATESSQFAALLGRYGVEGSKAVLILKSLSKEIAKNGQVLEGTNVATKNADGTNRSQMAVLRDLAEWYSKSTDKVEAMTVGTKMLGRGFAALIPVLAGGAKGFDEVVESAEKFGLILTQENIDDYREYAKAIKDNEQAVKGLQVQVGLAEMPMETWKNKTLGGILQKLRDINPELPKLAGGVGVVAGPMMDLGGKAMIAVGALPFLRDGLAVVSETAAGAGISLTGLAATATTTMATVGVEIFAVYEGYRAFKSLAESPVGWDFNTENLHALGDEWANFLSPRDTWLGDLLGMERTVSDVGSASATAAVGVGGLTDAQIAQKSAALNLADAQARLRDLQSSGKATAAELQRAELAVASAQNATTRTTNAEAQATVTLVRGLHGLMVAENSRSGSMRTLNDARRAAKTAALDVADADRTVIKLEKDGKKGTEEWQRATIAQAEAHQRQKDAIADASLAYVQNAAGTKNLSKEQGTLASKLTFAQEKVAGLKSKLDTVPKSKKSEVKAEIAAAEKNVDKIKREINGVHGKDVTIGVHVTHGSTTIELIKVGRVSQVIKWAQGGTIDPVPGGQMILAGEVGKRETAVVHEDTPRQRANLAAAIEGVFGDASPFASLPPIQQFFTGIDKAVEDRMAVLAAAAVRAELAAAGL